MKALNFNLMGRTLTVSHDLADLAPVTTAIERLGMAPVLQSTSDPEPSAPRDFGTSISRGQWIRMAVSGVLALGAEAMVFAGHPRPPGPSFLRASWPSAWVGSRPSKGLDCAEDALAEHEPVDDGRRHRCGPDWAVA